MRERGGGGGRAGGMGNGRGKGCLCHCTGQTSTLWWGKEQGDLTNSKEQSEALTAAAQQRSQTPQPWRSGPAGYAAVMHQSCEPDQASCSG